MALNLKSELDEQLTALCGPNLAGPTPRETWPTVLETFRAARDNTLTIFPKRVYKELVVARVFGRRVILFCSDPEGVGHVLMNSTKKYDKGVSGRRVLGPVVGNGVLTAERDDWRRQRRIVAPAFQNKRLNAFAAVMGEETGEMLDNWQAKAAGKTQAPRLDFASEMMGLTLNIICQTMFSTRRAAEREEMAAALDLYFDTAGRTNVHSFLRLPEWIPNPAHWRARPAISYLNNLVDRLIVERRKREDPGTDLLGLLMSARDDEAGGGLTDTEIKDNLITFVAAGHETTANALTWAIYLLSLFPDVADQIAREVQSICGTGAPSADQIKELVFTRMVLEEAMRLYPPAPVVSRESLVDDEVCGFPLPANSIVFISPWVIHRHEKLWSQPGVFDPQRFAPSVLGAQARFQYLPFGGGPRICVGQSFAMMEAITALAMIVRRYRLRVDPAHRVEPIGRITLRPHGGLPVFAEKRTSI